MLGQPEGRDPKACAAFWDVQPQWHQNLCVRADECPRGGVGVDVHVDGMMLLDEVLLSTCLP